MDRRLAADRAKLTLRGRSHSKPGRCSRTRSANRTWAQWDDAVPGFVETDLVGHEGGNVVGEHAYTVTVTDIASGWTPEPISAQQGPQMGHHCTGGDHARHALPGPRDRQRQRQRVHQPPPARLVPATRDHLDPVPARQLGSRALTTQLLARTTSNAGAVIKPVPRAHPLMSQRPQLCAHLDMSHQIVFVDMGRCAARYRRPRPPAIHVGDVPVLSHVLARWPNQGPMVILRPRCLQQPQ